MELVRTREFLGGAVLDEVAKVIGRVQEGGDAGHVEDLLAIVAHVHQDRDLRELCGCYADVTEATRAKACAAGR